MEKLSNWKKMCTLYIIYILYHRYYIICLILAGESGPYVPSVNCETCNFIDALMKHKESKIVIIIFLKWVCLLQQATKWHLNVFDVFFLR